AYPASPRDAFRTSKCSSKTIAYISSWSRLSSMIKISGWIRREKCRSEADAPGIADALMLPRCHYLPLRSAEHDFVIRGDFLPSSRLASDGVLYVSHTRFST